MSEQLSTKRMRMDVLQKNSKKGNRREQEGTRMGPGGIGMCRSNQNVWLSGSWVLHSLSQVKQFCHLVYFSSSEKPSEGWRWAVVICGTTNSFSRGKKFLFCDVSIKKLLNSVFKKKLIRQDIKIFFFFMLNLTGPLRYTFQKIMKRQTDPYGKAMKN